MEDTSTCEVRERLEKVLAAHPGSKTLPSRKVLPDGELRVEHKHGHQVAFDDGCHAIFIQKASDGITFVAIGPEGHIEGMSYPDGLLLGIDEVPKPVLAKLDMIAELPTHFS
jgi:hypothetical protein